MMLEVECGDMRSVLAALPENAFDSGCTDPPYHLTSKTGGKRGFMGKEWDGGQVAMEAETWRAVWRVLKPGAYLCAFGGTRTWHRIAVAIEDAGFEIRDNLAWLYGQGFPKSLDLAKAVGEEWNGFGTALKPSFEPVILARKPPIGTIASNVEAYGVGGLHIDACRQQRAEGDVYGWSESGSKASNNVAMSGANYAREAKPDNDGRWPPNVLCDEEVAAELDERFGTHKAGKSVTRNGGGGKIFDKGGFDGPRPDSGYSDSGGVSRYFYCPKANAKERDLGLEAWPVLSGGEATDRVDGTAGVNNPRAGAGRTGGRRNPHPTVKPLELMRWLVRLVTPPGGFVLDPFAGSGTTGCACALEGFHFAGVELDPVHTRLAMDRIAYWASQRKVA